MLEQQSDGLALSKTEKTIKGRHSLEGGMAAGTPDPTGCVNPGRPSQHSEPVSSSSKREMG